jgi:tol-pal system protein YbgF
MSFRSFRLPAAALALVLLAGTAVAQTPMDDPLDARDAKRVDRMEKVVRELRAIVFQAQSSGKPVVVQPADTDQRMTDLATRVDDLQQSLSRINGTIESLTHDLDVTRRDNAELKSQVKALSDQSADLQQKLSQAQTAPPAEAAPAAAAPPAASAADAFAHARQLMLSGDYDGAQAAFADYVQTYPDAPRTPEARYWLGKTLSVKGAHAQAAGAYIAAIRGWPKTAWAPDAVVELSRSLVALKKPTDACQTLGELDKRYPKAPAAVMTRAAAVRTQAKCAA